MFPTENQIRITYTFRFQHSQSSQFPKRGYDFRETWFQKQLLFEVICLDNTKQNITEGAKWHGLVIRYVVCNV